MRTKTVIQLHSTESSDIFTLPTLPIVHTVCCKASEVASTKVFHFIGITKTGTRHLIGAAYEITRPDMPVKVLGSCIVSRRGHDFDCSSVAEAQAEVNRRVLAHFNAIEFAHAN